MQPPPFKKVTAQKFEDFLREFFLGYLGYDHLEKDTDQKPGEPDYWHMVVPAKGSRPFAVAHQHGLSSMERRRVSRLYIEKVIEHRDGLPTTEPVLYCFTDGERLVFFSADAARNRDDRFDLSAETWDLQGVQDKVERLHISRLEFQTRLGRKRPVVDFLFESTPLSDRFQPYVRAIREELMRAVIKDGQALAGVIYYLLETREDRDSRNTKFVDENMKLRKSREQLYVELSMRLGDAIGAAVDTLLLRSVMVRFLEALHPEKLEGLGRSDDVLKRGKLRPVRVKITGRGNKAAAELNDPKPPSNFSETELELAALWGDAMVVDASRAKAKSKGSDQLPFDFLMFEDGKAGAAALLEEEDKRERRLGGDFYLADLGRAARAIEEVLINKPSSRGARAIQDFLGRTGDTTKQWQFRYEDLKPQTLQDYYESALGTAVQLSYNKTSGEFEIGVAKSQRQRKELGAYYTHARVCRFMVERTVKPLFDQRLETLKRTIAAKDLNGARQAFHALVTMSICDPTMGSAPFLRSAFDYLSSQYLPICRALAEAKNSLPALFDEISKEFPYLASKGGRMNEEGVGRWEWHVLRRMLYGLDIDLKAVCIACQTFALSALKYLREGERFPSFFNLNLKLGNALISPMKPTDRPKLAEQSGKEIGELIRLRRESMSLPNTKKSYDHLKVLMKRIDALKKPLIRTLLEERVAGVLESLTEELRPFCWELEFPEVFFCNDGTLREAPGFDVVIGNPPWEAIKFNDNEFLSSIGAKGEGSVEKLIRREKGVAKAYEHYRQVIEAWKAWVTSGGQYEHQQGGRDRNKWRLATELSWNLTSPQGAMSLVVPSGIIADEGGIALKDWILPTGEAGTFLSFEKDNDVFPGTQSFTVMDFRRGRPTREVRHVEGLTRADQIMSWPYEPLAVSIDLVKAMSPNALAIPSVRDSIDASLLEKLYRHPLIVDEAASWHAQTVSYDFHMGNDRKEFERGGAIPLLEGKSVEQYEVAQLTNIEKRVSFRRQVEPGSQYRIACADIQARSTLGGCSALCYRTITQAATT